MTERAQNFMDSVWSIRNSNPDMTEEQLLSAVLKLAAEKVIPMDEVLANLKTWLEEEEDDD